MIGSSLELSAIYGWIISLLEAITITGFMYWQMLPIQAFLRVSSLANTKEGTRKGIYLIEKTLSMSGELIDVVGKKQSNLGRPDANTRRRDYSNLVDVASLLTD